MLKRRRRCCTCGLPQETTTTSDEGSDDYVAFTKHNWTWDTNAKSPEVILYGEPMHATALVHPGWSYGTAGVRGTRPLNGRRCYWEIELSHRVFGTSIQFGIGTALALLHADRFVDLLGQDCESWALSHRGKIRHAGIDTKFTAPFEEMTPTTVALYFDGVKGTLSYHQDGRCLGVAFSDIPQDRSLYPMVTSAAAKTEMTLGCQLTLNMLSLADRAAQVVSDSVADCRQLNKLPLPTEVIGRVKRQRLDANCGCELHKNQRYSDVMRRRLLVPTTTSPSPITRSMLNLTTDAAKVP